MGEMDMDATEVNAGFPPDPPPFEMSSMIEDARGGLDMVKKETANKKS